MFIRFIVPSLSNTLCAGQRFDRRRNHDFMLQAWERLSRRFGAIMGNDLQSNLVCHLRSPERRRPGAAGTPVVYRLTFWNITNATTKKN